MSEYAQMVEDIRERIGADDEEYNPLEDVASHGADTGWAGSPIPAIASSSSTPTRKRSWTCSAKTPRI